MIAITRSKQLFVILCMLIVLFVIKLPNTVYAEIIHCGDITTNETWAAADNVHIVNCDVTVTPGVTLTIEPGAIVKLQTDDSIFVDGRLIASGLVGNPIYFTSYEDDSIGGDTNGDGSSTGSVEDWGAIRFSSGSDDTSIIENAIIRFGGNDGLSTSGDLGVITLDNASPVLQAITFQDNYLDGAQVSGVSWETDTWDNTDITYYLRDPLIVPASNTLTIATDMQVQFWADTTIVQGGTLVFQPGVIAKFGNDDSIFVDGRIQASGTVANPIYFTSYRDDTIGGDANGDGSSTGSVEDWGAIRFSSGSDDTSIIENAIIRFGGNDGLSTSGDLGVITLDNASPILQAITFQDNYLDGAQVSGVSWETDTWDNTDITYYLRDPLIVPASNTLTIATDMQVQFWADTTIVQGGTLVFQPGAIAKFGNDDSIFVDGRIQASGTVANPIYFTSYRDDTIGGDANGDGSSTGSVEDWGAIRFSSGSDDTSIIENAIIRFGGNDGLSTSGDLGVITLDNSSPILQAITFQDNYLDGAESLGGAWETDTWDNTDITYYLRDPLIVPASNTLTIATDMQVQFWADTTIVQGGTLVFQPGAIAKFGNDDSIFVDGRIQASGTVANPIYFTSYRDDTIGGDANGDGSSTGSVEDWGAIRFSSGSDDTSIIENAIIRFGGNDGLSTSGDLGSVTLNNASPIIRNSRMTDSYRGIEALSGSQPTLACNDIYNHTSVGIYNDTPSTVVIARNHWWGNSTGPMHSGNPSGTGESVSDGVSYQPWLNAPCFLSTPVEFDNFLYLPSIIK